MPKTTHTVTLPDGQTAKRVSQNRVYSHVVVGRRRYEHDRQRLTAETRAHAASDRRRWEYERECSTRTLDGLEGWRLDMERNYRDQGLAFLEANPDVDAYVVARAAEREATLAKQLADGAYERWGALTWASRLDLAQKAAGHSEWAAYETRVLPTTIKG